MRMLPGDSITADVTGLSLEGDGLATVGKRTVTIAGAFPGEHVEARIEHVSRQHPRAGAKLLKVLTKSPARSGSPCPDDVTNGGRCTGCALGAMSIEGQHAEKRALLQASFGLAVADIEAGEPWGYRHSSKRIAFGHGPRVGLGSYVRASHHAADMRHCRVDHPRIVEAARAIADAATALHIEPWDERTGEGILRAVWLKTDGTRVLATLVTKTDDPRYAALADEVRTVDAVAIAIAREGSNDLRGLHVRMLRGERELASDVGGEQFRVGPLGFLQPNPVIAARAYGELVAAPDGSARSGALALDLYAGAGVTTRLLRRHFAEVIPCESYPESANALGVAPSTAEAFLRAHLAHVPLRRPELVVANPPRAGLGAPVCALLRQLEAPAIAIMSCHPASLARDLAALTEGGLYRLDTTRAFDTLPQTPHVEIVVRLSLAARA